MFNGTILGNLSGFLYFTVFVLGGIFISQRVFSKLSTLTRLWLGCVMGTVLLMWLPVAISFILGFNILSHIIALILLFAGCVAAFFLTKKQDKGIIAFEKEDWYALAIVGVMTVFYAIVETNHIMAPSETGGMIFGQSTYFDANIHLSFITTPVVHGDMPFQYNISPTMQVSYPFLSDTISASIYVFGASLRWSYIVPTVLGAFTVFLGGFLFFKLWLKRFAKALLAWLLFFFNGGFGFMYFFDDMRLDDSENFTRIFDALYETPTNLNDKMIRWVNTFCDMMIPQRATLFGWMMLFAVLYLLYRAVFLKEKKMFIPAAVLAGLTPLISTHIFLSIGIICAVWMISRLYAMLQYKPKTAAYIAGGLVLLGAIIFLFTCVSTGETASTVDYDQAGFNVFVVCGIAIAAIFIGMLALALKKGFLKEIFFTWGMFLIIVLVLALPQLICFTFKQSSGNGFLTPHFNWINYRDTYFWFYVKNTGVFALLFIPAIFNGDKRKLSIVAPIAVLMLIAETVSLTPNVYDNNKLIYPAYALGVGLVADYMVALYDKLKGIGGRRIIATGVVIACVLSGTLSMGREYVAGEYEIYPSAQVEAAWWIQNNTENDSVIMCGNRYNNAISSLTGRYLVCGSDSFFSTHGLPGYSQLQNELMMMYSDPTGTKELYQKHQVDYIMVGNEERQNYTVNEEGIRQIATLVYSQNDVSIYKLN